MLEGTVQELPQLASRLNLSDLMNPYQLFISLLDKGGPRVHAFATVMAVLCMFGLSCYLGWCVGHEKKVAAEYIATISCMCGLGGYVYLQGTTAKQD